MPGQLRPIHEAELRKVRDFHSFRKFLCNQLRWPVPTEGDLSPEDLSFQYLARELQLRPEQTDRLKVRQLIPFHQGQPWGIFLLEFSSSPFYLTWIRQVMRTLAAKRRRDPNLPQWHHENLLFICTHDYGQFTFGHFSGDKPGAARLTTFTLDPEANQWRTLCEYNLPALYWPDEDGRPPEREVWLTQWKQAFDKEALTNRFFKVFREQFATLAKDIRKNNPELGEDEANTEAQIILERMLFLYFLQRKGWLDQKRDYLYRHFKAIYERNPGGTNYYSEFLSRVFQQLSTRGDISSDLIGRLPFLNGGLFEDDPLVQSADTLRRIRLKASNAAFRSIFDEMLERFNFTVREDTPLNQDVAIDPEMLGKILESLVLEMEEAGDAYAPDRRKATGSYYTPRIVVHFICREVLRQYLLARLEGPNWRERLENILSVDATDGIDQAEFQTLSDNLDQADAERIRALLADIKACDPAVGSGAFAVGLLHELVNLWTLCEARERMKDPRLVERNYLFHVKKRFVENSIYGVDILERAVEICKLRLWLALIVDYELAVDAFKCTPAQFAAEVKKLSPLPNLAFNIRRGDSLLDQIHGQEIILEEFVRREGRGSGEGLRLVGDIVKLKREFFAEEDVQKKRRLQIQILEEQEKLGQHFIAQQLEDLPAIQVQGLFGETQKEAERRRWREEEEQKLRNAQRELAVVRRELEAIESRKSISDSQARRLAALEGQTGRKLSFVWHLDFAEVFNRKPQMTATLRGSFPFVNELPGQAEMPEKRPTPSGFDIIVGNPPFVTARNPERRERYRRRWPIVCRGTYQLVAPFFARSFGLLGPRGELGLIVSNAFAKREFGEPLVEKFLPLLNLRKVVDCSGLMFPGHGTPTCVVFGSNEKADPQRPVRVVGILPGGGDLRTPPEESPLWHTIEARHDQSGFIDERIVVADHERAKLAKWPWNFDASVEPTILIVESQAGALATFSESYGSMFDTHKDEVFMVPPDCARRFRIEREALIPFSVGDQVRNWQLLGNGYVLKPYDQKWQLRKEDKNSRVFKYLRLFREKLGGRATFGGGTYEEMGEPWYRYHQMSIEKITAPFCIVYPEIGTHAHFLPQKRAALFTQTAPLILLEENDETQNLLFACFLNSSVVLFWLKQKCFSKREAEQPESDTYYEFAGHKVQEIPVPRVMADHLQTKEDEILDRLTELSRACWERGSRVRSLALTKLFEKPGEAYVDWIASLVGCVPVDPAISTPFWSTPQLREAYERARSLRDQLQADMVARQEEMDWQVYSVYGLLPDDHPAAHAGLEPPHLEREQRPFCLWKQAGSDYSRAVGLIPRGWPQSRRKLWEVRLAAIRDNEHIRRIEQPVYKRRWDEQWKLGNRWVSGPIAYAAEFVQAFEWWLCEKAEWWLENKGRGGPVEFDTWAEAMWKDSRIQAGWPVYIEELAKVEHYRECEKAQEEGRPAPEPLTLATDYVSFKKSFKRIVDEETVPEGILFAVAYDELEKKRKIKVPAKAKSIRGRLNVPRERFHLRNKNAYLWAGLQFR